MLIRAVWLEAHIFGWAVNRDTALDADRFAQFTADAFFLVDDGDLEKFGMIRAGLHGNTIEGTDINAELAGRAGFRVDFSFRNRQGLDLFNRVAVGSMMASTGQWIPQTPQSMQRAGSM